MKRIEVLNLHQNLIQLIETYKKEKVDKEFVLSMIFNKNQLETLSNSIREIAPQIDKEKLAAYMMYDAERTTLANEYAKKDESGNVISQKSNETITIMLTNPEEFKVKLEELKEKTGKDVIEEVEKEQKAWEELLQVDVDIELKKIKQEELPGQISFEDYEMLKGLIENDN